MGPLTTELCDRLRETAGLLSRVGESHWRRWLETSLRRIENSDLSGVDHLLGAYGGMGSFNDLVLSPPNAPVTMTDEFRELNDRLDELRSELYRLARAVRSNAEIAAPPIRTS